MDLTSLFNKKNEAKIGDCSVYMLTSHVVFFQVHGYGLLSLISKILSGDKNLAGSRVCSQSLLWRGLWPQSRVGQWLVFKSRTIPEGLQRDYKLKGYSLIPCHHRI